MTLRVALKIAYVGTSFHGYARQPRVSTVEGTLIEKLIEKGIISNVKNAQIRCASRTDKQVSALTNIMTFYTAEEPENILFILSNEFSHIFVYGITQVSESFNPRYALCRTYHYFLPKEKIPIDKLKQVLSLFVGKHDFTNFAKVESHRNPIRTIEKINIIEENNFFKIEITAQTFLWHQIRRILSAAIKYCKGKITFEQIHQALLYAEMPVDFNLAPAIPLVLSEICYPKLTFHESYKKKKRKKVVDTIKQEVTNLVF